MAVDHPFRRTYRPFTDGDYTEGGRSGYVDHPKFAQNPENYIRAFLLVQKDLQGLFEYIEPSDDNSDCYSYRIHALLLRACIEVEANCKAILKENGYVKKNNKGEDLPMDIRDYRKINATHRLSSYQVKIPYWDGIENIRAPFAEWASESALPWYDAYNATKHDRSAQFKTANFSNLLDACCGALVVLSAQFGTHDFSPADSLLSVGGPGDGMESAIGQYFRIRFPEDWNPDLQYRFNWQVLKDEPDPFRNHNYARV
jgi:hypothetical protein